MPGGQRGSAACLAASKWVVLEIGVACGGPFYKGAVPVWGLQKGTLMWRTPPLDTLPYTIF